MSSESRMPRVVGGEWIADSLVSFVKHEALLSAQIWHGAQVGLACMELESGRVL